jgi:hypothetical protein
VLRRISSAFKDVPGGQLLGRTRDYTQRLLDFSLLGSGTPKNGKSGTNGSALTPQPPLPTVGEGEQPVRLPSPSQGREAGGEGTLAADLRRSLACRY